MTNPDPRIVYGFRCTWWDSIDKVGKLPASPGAPWYANESGMFQHGLPCCPYCRGVLFEVESIDKWAANVESYCAKPDAIPNYRSLVSWMRGKCFPDMAAARAAFEAT